MEDLRKTYDLIASDWHRDHLQDDWWHEGALRFLQLLPEGGRVLDVGCGPGHTARYFAQNGVRVTGTDISERMVQIASREVPEAVFSQLDVYEIGTLDGVFEGIYAKAILLHIPKQDIVSVLGKIRSKLAPDGVFYLAVKEKRAGSEDERIETEDDYGYTYSRFFSYFTEAEMQRYLEEAGYRVEESGVKSSGNTNWIEIFSRHE